MGETTAFLELKYGWIYGGSPKFHIVSEVAMLVHNSDHNNILIFSKQIRGYGKVVTSFSETDEYGVTKNRVMEVLDLASGRIEPYDPNFKLNSRISKNVIARSYGTHKILKNFLVGLLVKFKPQRLVVFGGRRDVLLCEKAGVKFHRAMRILDTQEELKEQTSHLFSLNKISKITQFEVHPNNITSMNYEYFLPRHVINQLKPNSAALDVTRQFIAHQEFENHELNLLIKAQQHLTKIEQVQAEQNTED